MLTRTAVDGLKGNRVKLAYTQKSLVGCMEFNVPLENFSLETSPLPVKGCKFWPMLAFMAIEQWGFFNVPHPLRQGPTVYKGHLQGPVNSHLMPSVWQWSCHYLFLRLRSIETGDRTPISRTQGERSTPTPPRRWKSLVIRCCVGCHICFPRLRSVI